MGDTTRARRTTEPQGGYKVGDKVGFCIMSNNEWITGKIEYFLIYEDSPVCVIFGAYRCNIGNIQRYRRYMDGGMLCEAPKSSQLTLDFA